MQWVTCLSLYTILVITSLFMYNYTCDCKTHFCKAHSFETFILGKGNWGTVGQGVLWGIFLVCLFERVSQSLRI